ncbi:hypothetical protein F2981_12160 [Sinorhizobium meliloti]|nr:hypothetical protein [Sinorhizobium meliloti]
MRPATDLLLDLQNLGGDPEVVRFPGTMETSNAIPVTIPLSLLHELTALVASNTATANTRATKGKLSEAAERAADLIKAGNKPEMVIPVAVETMKLTSRQAKSANHGSHHSPAMIDKKEIRRFCFACSELH